MLLVAVTALPSDPSARAQAAAALGLVAADLQQRLGGTLPRVLLVEGSAERAQDKVVVLEAAGFAVVTLDPALVPGDDQRVLGRKVEFARGSIVVSDRQGVAHALSPGALALIQRGLKRGESRRAVTTNETQLDLPKALLTGGLLMTKKVERKSTHKRQSEEAFLLLERSDGGPDVMLYERQIDYRSLGDAMTVSSRNNLDLLYARIVAIAPSVPTDDRLLEPQFVAGIPKVGADAVDVALALVTLARRKGAPMADECT